MKKTTKADLIRLKKRGVRIIDDETDNDFEFESVEAKIFKDIQSLVLKQAETMTAIIGQLQTMNKSLLTELKKHAPIAPIVTVEPKIQVDAPKVEPKIEVKVPEQKPTAWKHKITSTNAAGRPLEIVSIPTEDVSIEESGMKYKGAE